MGRGGWRGEGGELASSLIVQHLACLRDNFQREIYLTNHHLSLATDQQPRELRKMATTIASRPENVIDTKSSRD